jgi:hypothetical protein
MDNRGLPNRVWIEIGVFTAVSLGLLLLAPGVFLFLIPLQVLAVRRGASAFGYAVLLLALLAAVVELAGSGMRAELAAAEGYLHRIQLFLSVLLLGGLWLVNEPRVLPYRHLLRIIIATGAAGLVAVPFIGGLLGDPEFAPTMHAYVADQPLLRMSLNPSAAIESPPPSMAAVELFANTIGEVLLRGVLFLYLVYLVTAWWLGSVWGARTVGMRSPIGRLVAFRLEPWCIWALLLSGAVVLGDALLEDIGLLSYAGWNVFSVFLFLFALQGIGVLQWLYRRYNVPGPMRVMIGVALVFMLFRPVLTFVPVFGLPLLGISETWIDFKRPAPGDQQSNAT